MYGIVVEILESPLQSNDNIMETKFIPVSFEIIRKLFPKDALGSSVYK